MIVEIKRSGNYEAHIVDISWWTIYEYTQGTVVFLLDWTNHGFLKRTPFVDVKES